MNEFYSIALILLSIFQPHLPQKYTQFFALMPESNSVVTHVYDGDTVKLLNGQKVRYIGMDTPEVQHGKNKAECFAKKSLQKNMELVLNKKVRLVKDISETDKYGRLLRYVYVEDEEGREVFVNDYLVKEGYATTLTIPPDVAYLDKLKLSQQQAEGKNKGLWKECK
jgi:micrococcal nuclease